MDSQWGFKCRPRDRRLHVPGVQKEDNRIMTNIVSLSFVALQVVCGNLEGWKIAESVKTPEPGVEEVQLNGRRLDRCYVTTAEISAGGELEFILKNHE